MNERIKELRRQAIDHCLDRGSQGNLSEEVATKFAELIIRECICQCDDENSQKYIMAHFGMKESDWS